MIKVGDILTPNSNHPSCKYGGRSRTAGYKIRIDRIYHLYTHTQTFKVFDCTVVSTPRGSFSILGDRHVGRSFSEAEEWFDVVSRKDDEEEII
jgi:hypothetical protein